MRYYQRTQGDRRNSPHFRQVNAKIWMLHPSYEAARGFQQTSPAPGKEPVPQGNGKIQLEFSSPPR